MKTLILIDFQQHYMQEVPEEKRKILIENVMRISRVFQVNNWPIVVVYFDSSYNDNYLVEEMRDILEYKKAVLVTKNQCDGSTEILDAIDLNKWPLDVTICGVYTNECVIFTINGLIEKDKNIVINILEDCIWPDKSTLIIDRDMETRIRVNNQNDLILI